MKQKIINTIWGLALLAACFPVGYAFQMSYGRNPKCGHPMFNMIIGATGMIIVFGLIFIFLRKYLIKEEYKKPTKITLIAISILIGAIYAVAMYSFKDAMLRCGVVL